MQRTDGYAMQAQFRWMVDVFKKHAQNDPERTYEAAIAEQIVNCDEFRQLCERKSQEGS